MHSPPAEGTDECHLLALSYPFSFVLTSPSYLHSFMHRATEDEQRAKQSLPSCYFLVSLLTSPLRFGENFDFKTHFVFRIDCINFTATP